jgi:hypothetical protein
MVGGWEEWLGLGRSDQLGGVISSVGCYVNCLRRLIAGHVNI